MATNDEALRIQCQELLLRLKMRQSELKLMIPSSTSNLLEPSTNFWDHRNDLKPEYARDKLRSVVKSSDKLKPSESKEQHPSISRSWPYETVDPIESSSRQPDLDREWSTSDRLHYQVDHDAVPTSYTTDENVGTRPSYSSRYMTTPKTRRKRELIDRNVRVDSKLDSARDMDTSDRLNFSYSQIEDDDMTFLKSALHQSAEEVFQDVASSRMNDDWHGEMSGNTRLGNRWEDRSVPGAGEEEADRLHVQDLDRSEGDPLSAPSAAFDSEVTYAKQLINDGNNKQMANFVKETQIRPRSILNNDTTQRSRNKVEFTKFQTTVDANLARSMAGLRSEMAVSRSRPAIPRGENAYKSPKEDIYSIDLKRLQTTSKVSFRSTADNSSVIRRESEKKLLGYDWIAALLDNDKAVINESEAFFEDLKEFRRINRDECSNQVYMEGPLALSESREPSPVAKAISDTKVKPYMVNERLFPVPIKKSLLSEFDDPKEDEKGDPKKEPTYEEPRFVRVSIPRSTLESPHRFKPHRRRSFDPTDSCGLMEHCLLGWENSRPAMIPTASNVGISEATTGISSKMATTLADAERLANSYEWVFPQPTTHRPDIFPSWRKNYQESVINMSTINATRPLQTSSLPTESESLRKSTTNLLNSTYSMMYEMERLKQERAQDAQTQAKGVA